ncbi:dimethylmenaquinone methyltransferase [Planotetraspora thailandica]|uniref:Dimethylmenaquinone methyltransferase n=1 Tax=Planotetraspora thailandica TaxID=487172 RepID=A0A8J3Y132_9ACTN|nr:FAD-binding and (Fe-S)-binding domain-containing protein [Planotetraspora thailandica]GII58811.1 dimethylmenaquinone methyltransferase [Planotetraspora thailandica]
MSLYRDLSARVDGEVRIDEGSLAAYSHDSSNYRQTPAVVVVPRTVDAGAEAVRVCHEHGAPIHSRGGGTSLAGQCVNSGVVIDWSKYCTRLLSVEEDRALVEPGICLDDLNARLADRRLMVGPKPATHDTCTIGGMIGNNSCGASAQAYGKMVDSVIRLEVLTYGGLRMWVGETSDEEYDRIVALGGRRGEIYQALRALRGEHLALIRTRYPDIPRRVSGYNLDSLLPENGFDVARALVGSESTLVTVLRAEIRLFPVPPYQSLAVLGYDDIAAAGDAVAAVTAHRPLAVEGLDHELMKLAREERFADEQTLGELPEGSGWLMVRFGGDTQRQADERARALIDGVDGVHTALIGDPAEEERLWKVREAGLGATAYPPDNPDTHEGWEDAAVPPERLGDYLRDFRGLLHSFGYRNSSLYGHFGQGCVHTRTPFDLDDPQGVATYRRFVEEAARLVASYGGSLSGEHGDGQARGELLPIMFGDEIMDVFAEFKRIWDPDRKMNPGKIVDPYRVDENLDHLTYHPEEPRTHFDFPRDGHRFAHAAARCVGIGKCRSTSGGVMCPSYRATREERHSTRGRARILMEMMRGETIADGWRSGDVRDALDLCLACKGCRGECPVHVDMATYKAEFLSHHYRWRLRPAAHYSMGWLPLWAMLASAAPQLVNTLTHAPGLSRMIKAAGGVDGRRELPRFAPERFTDWFKGRPPATGDPVVLWPDTFTDNFRPEAAKAAVRLLEACGFRVEVPPVPLCCGLTWISTGQLGVAQRVLRRTADALAPRLRRGVPVVGLEPSCLAVLRSDGPELLSGDLNVRLLAERAKSLSEVLFDRAPPAPLPGTGIRAIAQPHCHQHSLWGFDADRRLLERVGVQVEVLDAGCCGLAGNFGFERGHHEISAQIAELGLWPAVRQAGEGTRILADGFSCRTQIESGTAARPVHLAELLAEVLLRDRAEGQPTRYGSASRRRMVRP